MKSDKETKVCLACNKEFMGVSSRRFCSRDCYRTHIKTNEGKVELIKVKSKKADIVQEALKSILTFEYILHGDLHRKLNLYVRENSNKKEFDIEFIDLSDALEKFEKNEHYIEWKIEKIDSPYNRRNVYLRLGSKEYCEQVDREKEEELNKRKNRNRRVNNG